jgi:hypothetical protein
LIQRADASGALRMSKSACCLWHSSKVDVIWAFCIIIMILIPYEKENVKENQMIESSNTVARSWNYLMW